MRFLIILTLFSIALSALGQNRQGANNGSKISDTEKKRLENEFKALGSFYIDDSGLVVYQNKTEAVEENTQSTKGRVVDTASGSPTRTEPIEKKNTVVDQRKNKKEEEEEVVVGRVMPPTIKTKTTVSPNASFFKKEIVNEDIKSTTTENSKKEVKVTSKKEIYTSSPGADIVIPKTEKSTIKSASSAKSQKKGSILNQRRESQYKTMEEAALAVEALLEELKKEEGQTTSAGSMSSKLSKGVNKDLRKKTEGSNINIRNSNIQNKSRIEIAEDEYTSEFGVEPSYFINGEQVDKVEVSKLNKKDIIRREIRVRNTVTGNPNGEVWYEVK